MGYVELEQVKDALLARDDIRLTNQERIVILDMADALRPATVVYEFGWDRLAKALGKVPGTKAAERALERVVLGLRTKGVLDRIRVGGNGRTAAYDMLLLTEVRQESCPPLLGELPPTSDGVAPHSEGGVRAGKGQIEGQGADAPPPPTCSRHPLGWDHDQPCRTCMAARLAHLAAEAPLTRPTQSYLVTVQPSDRCAPGRHLLVGDGTCRICPTHPDDIAAEPPVYGAFV